MEPKDVVAGQFTGEEVKRLNELQDNPNVTPDQYEQIKQQFASNDAVVKSQLAHDLQEQVVEQNENVESADEVRVVEEDGKLVAQQTEEAVREDVSQKVASQNELVDDPDNVIVQKQGDEYVGRPTQNAVRQNFASQHEGVDPEDVKVDVSGEQITVSVEEGVATGTSGDTISQREQNQEYGTDYGETQDEPTVDELINRPQVEESGPNTRRRRTESPASNQPDLVETVDEASPLAAMGAGEDQVEQAVAGEKELARQAEEGDAAAAVGYVGRELQLQAAAVRQGAEEAGAKAGGPQVGEATVGEQVGSFVGGTVAFPALLAGGALEAGGLAGQPEAREGAGDRVSETGAQAAKNQADFVTDRPVEAALIAGTAVVGSPRARAAAKSGGKRAAGAAKASGRSAAERAGVEEFVSSERAQAQLTGKSKGSGKSKSSSQDLDTGVDPRIFERNRGRGGGERSAGVEPETGSRPARSGIEGQRQFAERVRGTKAIERQTPETDLRQVVDYQQPADTSAAGAAGAGDLLAQAQEQQAVVDQSGPVAQQQGQQTQGGASDAVTRGAQRRLEAAQQPAATMEEVLSGQPEDVLLADGVDVSGQGAGQLLGQQDQQVLSETDAVQQSGATQGQSRGSRPDQSGRGRSKQREGIETRQGTGQTPGQTPGQDESVNVTPTPGPTQQMGLITAQVTVTDDTGGFDGPGRPQEDGKPPGKPSSPPNFSFGLGAGLGPTGTGRPNTDTETDDVLNPGWLNETIVDIATGGEGSGSPSQQQLEQQSEAAMLTGQLPTQAEVAGDEETQEDIAAVEALLSFGASGSGNAENGASGGGSDDGEGLLDLALGEFDDGEGLL